MRIHSVVPRAVFVCLVVLGLPSAAKAAAYNIDFNVGPVGQLGSQVNYAVPGGGTLSVNGWYWNGSSYVAANLFRRNDGTADRGYGVCNPIEGSSCGSGSGSGDINELDNGGADGRQELISITLPVGWRWVEVGLSSVDGTERGQLYKDTDNNPNNGGQTLLKNFVASGADVEPELNFAALSLGSSVTAQALFFKPKDWSGGGSLDNDFLIHNVIIENLNQVPEPATMFLVGTGVLAGVRARRRAKRNA